LRNVAFANKHDVKEPLLVSITLFIMVVRLCIDLSHGLANKVFAESLMRKPESMI